MDSIEALISWAKAQGVELHGIAPKHIQGRGIGFVATRRLEVGEAILVVPTSTLRSIGNTPKAITRKLKGTTVHGTLAASLALETNPDFDKWRAVFPNKEEVEGCMPAYWPPELRDLLPDGAKAVLAQQIAKIDKDWKQVSAAYPDMAKDDYLYSWHLINSRTFYHVTPKTEKLHKDDRMVLQPVADLFNHDSERGCSVAFDANDYTITTKHSHEDGDEVFIQYGSHSNDLLLVEYGFTLPGSTNKWDETLLDAYICPLFNAAQKKKLEDAGFWGDYKLDAETPVCYRTQVAVRLLLLNDRQWKQVVSGRRDEEQDKDAANKELLAILRRYEKDIRSAIREIDGSKIGEASMRLALRGRWAQLREIVAAAMSRIE